MSPRVQYGTASLVVEVRGVLVDVEVMTRADASAYSFPPYKWQASVWVRSSETPRIRLPLKKTWAAAYRAAMRAADAAVPRKRKVRP